MPLAAGGRARARSSPTEGEAVCLSTCNRTELYLVGEDAERRALAALGRAQRPGRARSCARSSTGSADEAAALHLFRVAAGLDSLVPGEGEILGQVRAAFEAGTTGPGARPAVPPGAARRQEGARRDGDRREPRVGLVGRGRARPAGVRPARRAAGCCSSAPVTSPSSPRAASPRAARRSPSSPIARRRRAARARVRFGGEGIALERRRRPCSARSTWSSRRPARRAGCSRATSVEAALRGRKGRPLFLIDLAVPRDLDPAIHELDGVLPLRHRRPRVGGRFEPCRTPP